MDKIRINLEDLLLCISNAQDLVSPQLSNHHQRVAYLTYRLVEQINLPIEQQKDIFLAALVHDIGALSANERLEFTETESSIIDGHAFRGAKLLEGFRPLRKVANIIKFHHLPWNNGEGNEYMGENVPLASHIIHLADRICTRLIMHQNVIVQLPNIIAEIQEQSNTIFVPILVEAMLELCKKEYIWLDLMSPSPMTKMPNRCLFNILVLEIDDIVDLALIFSQIIDFRSSFTARHSAGVAKTSERLAQLVGFSPLECKMMLVAGYLHDLGKLAISNDILEKPVGLSEDEFNEIRTHTYYTYQLLEPIAQFKTINIWASYHHERLDGKGYPFHIEGDKLSLGARVMAVSDVFTAITENRPYRMGMDAEQAKRVLNNMVDSGALDRTVVRLLVEDFQTVNDLREKAQQDAVERYEKFMLS